MALYDIKKFQNKEVARIEGNKYLLGRNKVIKFKPKKYGVKKRSKLRTGFKKLKK